jgi:23S rRNA (cytosine1962-C5)-methyltransferase
MDLSILEKRLSNISTKSLQDSQRILHGRGQCYSSFEQITIDWFNSIILITQFKEQDGFNVEHLKNFLLDYFKENFSEKTINTIVFQDRSKKMTESTILYGDLPEHSYAVESGLKFHIDLLNFQNIGFFLDAKNARSKLIELCKDKRVLNLFSFTCAFSVCAVANGAKSVVNLDMGKGVLERGRLNHELNSLEIDLRAVTYIKSDIFKAWKKLHKYGRYDLIVIDPPSFQKGSFNAAKDYRKIASNLHRLLEKDAKIIACLNSPFLSESFLDDLFLNGPLNTEPYQTQRIERLPNPEAFCDIDSDAGLKVVVYQFNRDN